MTFDWGRALKIARREYVSTVKRKAFLFTLLLTPAFYAFVMFIMVKPQADEAVKQLKSFRALAVVDSSGLLASASRQITNRVSLDALDPRKRINQPKRPPETSTTRVEFFTDQGAALAALEADSVKQVVVVPGDYLETGKVRRYVKSENLFNDNSSERPVLRWLSRGLLAGRVDSLLAERSVNVSRGMEVYRKNDAGGWELKNDAAELLDFFVPFLAAILLGMCIIIGGQYLLQGVSEEKESRILESMLCAVTAEDLVVGKLIGLGSAGLTLVAGWLAMGAFASGPALLAVKLPVTPFLVAMMVVYFVLGYFFYASLMTGIGAMTNNLREANQFAMIFTLSNFLPFYMLSAILGSPNSPLALGLSLFPPTAPVTMILRLSVRGANVPMWQVGASVAILLLAGILALMAAAKVFRTGLLMYGKTPNLPEIVRWIREK